MLKLITDPQQNEHDLLHSDLDELARLGAKKILMEALQLEVQEYIDRHSPCKTPHGHQLVVRNGKAQLRRVTVGSGTIEIEAPRVHDRRPGEKFTSKILPPYLRKSANVESILPILYLKGLSGNAFYEALSGLLGKNVGGLSSSSISSLKRSWIKEMEEWKKREINKNFVYLWADGVHVNIRLGEDKKLCLLVVIGVSEDGSKELLAVEAGYRESKEAWKMVFDDLLDRKMGIPLLIIGDGGLGLWAAIREIEAFDKVREQRCWVHKIANVLDKLPKRLQPQAKSLLHEMMKAAEKKHADEALQKFEKEFKAKYKKAVDCLKKDWGPLTSFFDFPGEHWEHIRTSNAIESAFATVKLRTKVTKGAGSTEMAKTMAFKLLLEAQKKWRKIRGYRKIKNLLSGALYRNGKIVDRSKNQKAVA